MKKLLSNKWVTLFLTVGLLKPNGIDDLAFNVGGYWGLLSSLFTYIRYMDIALVFLLFVLSSKRNSRVPYLLLAVLLFELSYVLSNFINDTVIITDLKHGIVSISLCMIIILYNRYGLLDKLTLYTGLFIETLIIINFASIIAYPNGMYVNERGSAYNYFLGFKNRNIYYYLPCLIARYYHKVTKKGKLDLEFYLLVLSMLLFSVYIKSSTTVMAIIFAFIMLIYYKRKKKDSSLNFLNIVLYSVAGTLILFLVSSVPQFQWLIMLLFDKEGTFTGRTIIWMLSFRYFLKSPFFGNGSQIISGYTSRWDVTQAHNRYIDMLYRGGVIMFISYFIMILMLERNSKKYKDNRIRNMTMIFFASYSILFLMEAARSDSMFFYSLMLMYFSKNLTAVPL